MGAGSASATTADELQGGRIRGSLCANFARWGAATLGADQLTERLSGLGPEDQEHLDLTREDLGFLPNLWVPAPTAHRVIDAMFEGFTPEERVAMFQDAGVKVFTASISGLQRALFSLLLTPERYLKHAHKAWRHNFDSGELEFESGENYHRCVYHQWEEHHPAVCAMVMHGKLAVYRAMGKKDARVTIVCCTGGEGCESIVEWGE